MQNFGCLIIIILSVLLSGLGFCCFVAVKVYEGTLVRTSEKVWPRIPEPCEDEEQNEMYKEAARWSDANGFYKQDVSVTNGGFRLSGEYYNFGFERVCIIIPGRTESLHYSKYYAEPYKQAGYNVLVIDNRCHGLSEGKFYSVGHNEYKDVLAWAKYAFEELGNTSVFLHGICIGSATALYCFTKGNAPSYISGMCGDGMYKSFCETFKNHMKHLGHPVFPVLYIVMFYLFIMTGSDSVFNGPLHQIKKMNRPILFIYSREDLYSLPKDSMKIYNKCGSRNKQIKWFEKGAHSHVRFTNTAEYDRVVVEFAKNI